MLEIKDLCVVHEGLTILNNLNLTIRPSEKHVLMGPNGAGKSTLVKILSGDPSYKSVSGEILFYGENLLDLSPEERAHKGLFVGFQSPPEIPGVPNQLFLKEATNIVRKARGYEPLLENDFNQLLTLYMSELGLSKEFSLRYLNENFSGGEKKRNEVLQMLLLNPTLAVLDEIDSGLDVDAIKQVSYCLKKYYFSMKTALLLITHYPKLVEYIKPDYVHIFSQGRIIRTGSMDLVEELDNKGYDSLLNGEENLCPLR